MNVKKESKNKLKRESIATEIEEIKIKEWDDIPWWYIWHCRLIEPSITIPTQIGVWIIRSVLVPNLLWAKNMVGSISNQKSLVGFLPSPFLHFLLRIGMWHQGPRYGIAII